MSVAFALSQTSLPWHQPRSATASGVMSTSAGGSAADLDPHPVGERLQAVDPPVHTLRGLALSGRVGVQGDRARPDRDQDTRVRAVGAVVRRGGGDLQGAASAHRDLGAGAHARGRGSGRPAGPRSSSRAGGRRRPGVPCCTIAPVLDDEQPVGQHHRVERVVGDEQGRTGEVGQVPAQFGADVEAGARVERGQGLVEQQQLRSRGQRAGQRNPLGLPARERTGLAGGELGQPEPGQPDPSACAFASARPTRCARGPNATLSRTRQVREQPVVLKDQPDRTVARAEERVATRRRRTPRRRG